MSSRKPKQELKGCECTTSCETERCGCFRRGVRCGSHCRCLTVNGCANLHYCGCDKDCSTKMCGCNKRGVNCAPGLCKCRAALCVNNKHDEVLDARFSAVAQYHDDTSMIIQHNEINAFSIQSNQLNQTVNYQQNIIFNVLNVSQPPSSPSSIPAIPPGTPFISTSPFSSSSSSPSASPSSSASRHALPAPSTPSSPQIADIFLNAFFTKLAEPESSSLQTLMSANCVLNAFGSASQGSSVVTQRLRQIFSGVQCLVLSLDSNQVDSRLWVQAAVMVKQVSSGQESRVSLTFQLTNVTYSWVIDEIQIQQS